MEGKRADDLLFEPLSTASIPSQTIVLTAVSTEEVAALVIDNG